MRDRRLVRWKERRPPSQGTCVEVERDKKVYYSRTLCGQYVMLPGPTETGIPTCEQCLTIMRQKERHEHEEGHEG